MPSDGEKAKAFKEVPFLQSDLEREGKPGVYKPDESVIPVRTWARGSPFRVNPVLNSSTGERSTSKGSVGNKSESSGEYGDLEKYWPGEGEEILQEDEPDFDGINDALTAPITFGKPKPQQAYHQSDEDDDVEVDDNDDGNFNRDNSHDGDSFLEDSGRPELASVGKEDPDTSIIEAFNQVYAQYIREEQSATRASRSGSAGKGNSKDREAGGGIHKEQGDFDEDDDDDDDATAPSYEESQRVCALLTRHLSGTSLVGTAGDAGGSGGNDGKQEEEDMNIGDLAAYLGLTDSQGVNVFRPDGDGDGDGDDDGNDDDGDYCDGFEDDEDDEGRVARGARELDGDDEFLPLRKHNEGYKPNNARQRQKPLSGLGGTGSMSRAELQDIASEYQNIVAAMKSPRAADGQGMDMWPASKAVRTKQQQPAKDHLKLLKRSRKGDTLAQAGGPEATFKGTKDRDKGAAPAAPAAKGRKGRNAAAGGVVGSAALATSDSEEEREDYNIGGGGGGGGGGEAEVRGLGDAEQRHRQYLAEVAARRRNEDEMLMRLAIKAERRRKKFKEALLERALRARAMAETAAAEQAQAQQSQAQVAGTGNKGSGGKDKAVGDGAGESIQAALRKRFKEQHKKMLAALMDRNREEERLKEEEAMREAERRGAARRKSLRAGAAAGATKAAGTVTVTGAGTGTGTGCTGAPETNALDEGDGSEQACESASASATGTQDDIQVAVYKQALDAALGAGSALQAVRNVRRSRSQGAPRGGGSDGAGAGAEGGESGAGIAGDVDVDVDVDGLRGRTAGPGLGSGGGAAQTDEQRAARKLQAQLQKAKVAAYLLVLAESKKREEVERKRAGERAKKRVLLLSTRIMSEANERKLMCAEDKPRHRAVAQEKEQERASGNSKRFAQQLPAQPKNRGAAAEAKAGAKDEKDPKTKDVGDKDKDEDKDMEGPSGVVPGGPSESKRVVEKTFKLPPKVVGGSVISAEAAEALFQRLKARQAKTAEGVEAMANTSVPARDFADWKRKNAVPSDGLVFAMTGWYPCVKQALLDRGWYFNSDTTSPFFDLKWTLRSMETDQDLLQPWQLTNHFMKNVAITTKVGLIKSLAGLVWLADVEANDVIPRGYDLSLPQEMQAFIDDFRCQRAECVLKAVYQKATGASFPPVDIHGVGPPPTKAPSKESEDDEEDEDDEDDEEKDEEEDDKSENETGEEEDEGKKSRSKSKNKSSKKPSARSVPSLAVVPSGADVTETAWDEWVTPKTPRVLGAGGSPVKVNAAVFRAACEVLEVALNPLNDAYLDTPLTKEQLEDGGAEQVTGLQWELLNGFDVFACNKQLPAEPETPVDGFLQEVADKDKERSAGPNSQAVQKRRIKERANAAVREQTSSEVSRLVPLTDKDIQRVHHLLCSMVRLYRGQARLNGQGESARNIWIVKPAAKSRGRGITTFSDLPKLLRYVDAGSGGSQSSQWIVQKYMENPLTIANHKFDLRQWVLVTDWNPLTVYFYDECYARFSVEQYSTKESDMDNPYIHLVNNSISKNSEQFSKKVTAENGVDIEGYMWDQDSFRDYVIHSTGQDLMTTKIRPRMRDIAKWSLMCASECIEHRKNSWELYGFDFMVDDSYNAWLIEINSSPACDYSTSVTERYVKKALVELLQVTLDVRNWEAAPKKTRGERPETGGWELIHKGPLLEMPAAAFGTDLSVGGTGIKGRPRPPPTTLPFASSSGNATSTSSSASNVAAAGNSSSSSSSSVSMSGTTTAATGAAQRSSTGAGLSVSGSAPASAAAAPHSRDALGSNVPSSRTETKREGSHTNQVQPQPPAAAAPSAAGPRAASRQTTAAQAPALAPAPAPAPASAPPSAPALGAKNPSSLVRTTGNFNPSGSFCDSLDGDSIVDDGGVGGGWEGAEGLSNSFRVQPLKGQAQAEQRSASEAKENAGVPKAAPPRGAFGAAVAPLTTATAAPSGASKSIPVPPVGRNSAPIKVKTFDVPF